MFKLTPFILRHLPAILLFLLAGLSFWLSPGADESPPPAIQTTMEKMRVVRFADGKKIVLAADKMLRHGDKKIEVINSEVRVTGGGGKSLLLRGRLGETRDGSDILRMRDIVGKLGDGDKSVDIRAAAIVYHLQKGLLEGREVWADYGDGYFRGDSFSWDGAGNLRINGDVAGRFIY